MELAADTGARHGQHGLTGAGHLTVASEQGGHVHRQPRIADPAGETRHIGCDPGNFGHHDYGGTASGHIDGLGLSQEVHLLLLLTKIQQ